MGTLSGHQIKEMVDKGELIIEPFDEDNIEPASLDLTLGPEAFIAKEDKKRHLGPGDVLTIPAGGTVLVLTQERLEVNRQIAGNIGLRSYFTRKGIDILSGPQIDPGFEGPLHIVLINLSPSKQVIEFGERIVTVEFRELSEEASERYSGQYQLEEQITAKEIRDLKEGEGIALSEAVQAMQTIAKDVSALEDNISRLSKNVDWYMRIF